MNPEQRELFEGLRRIMSKEQAEKLALAGVSLQEVKDWGGKVPEDLIKLLKFSPRI